MECGDRCGGLPPHRLVSEGASRDTGSAVRAVIRRN